MDEEALNEVSPTPDICEAILAGIISDADCDEILQVIGERRNKERREKIQRLYQMRGAILRDAVPAHLNGERVEFLGMALRLAKVRLPSDTRLGRWAGHKFRVDIKNLEEIKP